NLGAVTAVGIGYKQLHFKWRNKVLFQVRFIFYQIRIRSKMRGAPYDLLAIRRKTSAPIIAGRIGNLFYIASIQVHGVKFQVATAVGSKDYFISFGRNGGLG